ncbi:DUF4347 domain-containing protein [Candidatus Magnetaquicoccus inordinatus]|uniref:DUF4347 domain-containing protein n=1 Tax=Candidatus Magnetaquicoccus inordinatus TaxID=2496818 RepID=UPI00102B18AA|nr:DUF4347 domain-containing protein [Candidatus Magnetaquicoccus inordinatus]
MLTDHKQEGRLDLLAKELRHLLESYRSLPAKRSLPQEALEQELYRHVMVIDARIRDFQTICFAIQADVCLMVLDGDHEGIQDLLIRLHPLKQLQSISIISPGQASEIRIGQDRLSASTLPRYAASLRQLSSHLTVQGVLVLFGMRAGEEQLEAELLVGLRQIMGCRIMTSAES